MALQTSGFQLSQFERAPQLPTNIGVVDTKAIYGAVTDALKTHEALRTAQQVQEATDAELALATQKAQTEQGLLGSEAAARKAKADLLTAGAPYQQALLPLEDQARRTELSANLARNRLLSKPEIAEQAVLGKILTPAEREIRNLSARLQDPDLTEEERAAIQVRLKQQVDANTAAKNAVSLSQVKPVTLADGTVMMVPSHMVPSTGTGVGAAPAGTAAPAGAAAATTDMAGAGVLSPSASMPTKVGVRNQILAAQSAARFGASTPPQTEVPDLGTPVQQQYVKDYLSQYGNTVPLNSVQGEEAKKSFIKHAERLTEDAQKEITNQQVNLDTWATEAEKERETEATLKDLIRTAKEKGIQITGGGVIGAAGRALMPGEAAAFQSRLAAVSQQLQLGNMMRLKNASASGATGFGNLTESEGAVLRADYGNLNQKDLPPDALVATLERAQAGMAARRQEALTTIQSRIDRARRREIQGLFNVTGLPGFRSVSAVHPLEQAAQPQASVPTEVPMGSVQTGALEASQAAPAAAPLATPAPTQEPEPLINFGETPAAPTPAPAPAAPAAPAVPIAGTENSDFAPVTESDVRAMVPPQPASNASLWAFGPSGESVKNVMGKVVDRGAEALSNLVYGETPTTKAARIKREDEILRTSPNSWAAYDIRRDRGLPGPVSQPKAAPTPEPEPVEEEVAVTEETPKGRETVLATGDLPQIKLSPETRDIVQRVYDQYLYNTTGKPGTPVLASRKGGAEKPAKLDNRTIWAILSNPADFSRQIQDESLRGEFDMAATRAMNDARMLRAQQMRAYEAANPRRGR